MMYIAGNLCNRHNLQAFGNFRKRRPDSRDFKFVFSLFVQDGLGIWEHVQFNQQLPGNDRIDGQLGAQSVADKFVQPLLFIVCIRNQRAAVVDFGIYRNQELERMQVGLQANL